MARPPGSKSTETVRVSVIIPTYNCARYLQQAINSVLSQSYKSREVIVVDDGSTDNTRVTLKPYQGRISYIYQENKGVSAARNRGIQVAQGEFVAFLDGDDFFLPEKLGDQVSMLEKQPSLGLVNSGWRVVDQSGKLIRDVEPWRDAPRLDLKSWLLWKPVFPGAMMIRRCWLNRSNGFDIELSQAEDVDLVLRLALMGCKAAWVQRPTVCYRQRKGSAIRDTPKQAEGIMVVLDKFFGEASVPRKIRRLENKVRYYTLMWAIWQLVRKDNATHAIEYLREARSISNYAPTLAVLDWFGELTKWSIREGREVSELRSLWPHFRVASGMDDALWQETEKMLDWWLDVWWHYQFGFYDLGAEALQALPDLSPRELVKLLQSALLHAPLPVKSEPVSRFWRDAIVLGKVPMSARHEVTTLYLTIFSRGVFTRRPHMAVDGLLQAAWAGLHPNAIPAWRRFFRSAIAYFFARPSSARP